MKYKTMMFIVRNHVRAGEVEQLPPVSAMLPSGHSSRLLSEASYAFPVSKEMSKCSVDEDDPDMLGDGEGTPLLIVSLVTGLV